MLSLHVCVSVCVEICTDVNEGGTNRNRCTQRLVILYAKTYYQTLITNQQAALTYFTS